MENQSSFDFSTLHCVVHFCIDATSKQPTNQIVKAFLTCQAEALNKKSLVMDPYQHIQPGFSFIFLRFSSLYLRSTLTDIPPDIYLYNLEKPCKLVCMYHTSM